MDEIYQPDNPIVHGIIEDITDDGEWKTLHIRVRVWLCADICKMPDRNPDEKWLIQRCSCQVPKSDLFSRNQCITLRIAQTEYYPHTNDTNLASHAKDYWNTLLTALDKDGIALGFSWIPEQYEFGECEINDIDEDFIRGRGYGFYQGEFITIPRWYTELKNKHFYVSQSFSFKYEHGYEGCGQSVSGYPSFVAEYGIPSWKRILEHHHEGDIVQGTFIKQTPDGLIVKIYHFDALMPIPELDLDSYRKPKDFLGQTLDVKILKIYPELHKVVVSRKHLASTPEKNKSKDKSNTRSAGEINELLKRIEQLEARVAKLEEPSPQNFQSTVEKHDGWW